MKRKVLKKMFALALTASMVAGAAACGNNDAGSGSSQGGQESSKEESSAVSQGSEEQGDSGEDQGDASDEGGDVEKYTVLTDENGEVYDLGGMEIILRDWWTDPDKKNEDASAYDEAREEYLDWIQKTYNFTFVQKQISDWGSAPEDFVNYATTGGDENYLFINRPGGEFINAMQSDLMWDLTQFDCLDFSEPKWSNGTHRLFALGDAIYGMSGEYPEAKGGMYFNKRILSEAGIDPEEIYNLQESGEWTWEKFEEICSKVARDTDNDGVTDVFAMMSQDTVFFTEAVYSNGGEYVGINADGTYFNQLESEATLEAMNWAKDMRSKYEMVAPEGSEWSYFITAFQNGETCFVAEEAYKAGGDFSEENMKDDFGFVCFPKGPKMDDYTNMWCNNPVCIPKIYDEEKAWKLAFAYNLYTDPVPGYEDYEVYKYTYYPSMRDTESVDYTIKRMQENGGLTYHSVIPGIEIGDVYWDPEVGSGDKSFAQKAEEIRPTWQAYLDEVNKRIK